MLSRARLALPGMAFAVLLATPGLAFAEPTNLPPVTRKPAVESRKATTHPAPRISQARTFASAEPAAAPILSDSGTVWRQTGVASWYGGNRWHGKLTASGVRYDQNQLTAAHATLPIGTKVRVTLEGTDRSVIVVINDRPGTRRRIIDLSRAAAADLGILSQGVAVVSLSAL